MNLPSSYSQSNTHYYTTCFGTFDCNYVYEILAFKMIGTLVVPKKAEA